MEHVCDSECDHSELESEQEEAEEGEELQSETDGELVEFTDNDESEVEDDSDYEYEEFICDSHCPSDCDGDHHECSSECGCEIVYSESDDENKTIEKERNMTQTESDNATSLHAERDDLTPLHNAIASATRDKALINGIHKRQASLPESSTLLLKASNARQSQRAQKLERNNNKLVVSNSVDLVDELQSAIDARVKRSASCREVPMHRKTGSSDNKLDGDEREARRKDRRARLRTLELKREQILGEVRDGTKDRINDAMYSEVVV